MPTNRLLGLYKEVPLSTIDIDNIASRRPIDLEHVKMLQQSISARGLINPVTLYQPTDSIRYKLLAGLHRYTAFALLDLPSISARIYDHELSSYELKAIEVYENLQRKDLTDVEKALQTNQLHDLMQQASGRAIGGGGSTGRGHSIRDTAKILGKSVGSVHGDIKIAQAIKTLPELNIDKATSRADALRILQRFSSIVENQAIARKSAETTEASADPYIVGDFFDNTLEAESFAFIECDPPYGINIELLRKGDVPLYDYQEVLGSSYPNFLQKLANECYRLASPNSWIILWHGPQWYTMCIEALRNAGFICHNVPAIWKKGSSTGQTNAPDMALGNSYESFIYAHKGSPKLFIQGHSNVFDFPRVPPSLNRHPTERPVSLIHEILRVFTWPNTSVLCPFLGSGNTIIAARQLGLQCTGYDLSQQFHDEFVARLTKETIC